MVLRSLVSRDMSDDSDSDIVGLVSCNPPSSSRTIGLVQSNPQSLRSLWRLPPSFSPTVLGILRESPSVNAASSRMLSPLLSVYLSFLNFFRSSSFFFLRDHFDSVCVRCLRISSDKAAFFCCGPVSTAAQTAKEIPRDLVCCLL